MKNSQKIQNKKDDIRGTIHNIYDRSAPEIKENKKRESLKKFSSLY